MQVHRFLPTEDHPFWPYLHSIWRIRTAGSHSSEMVLPKANVDLIFNLGSPQVVTGHRAVAPMDVAAARVAGLQTGALISRPTGEIYMLGISLKAEGCAALLPLPANELTDRAVEGTLILPEMNELMEQLYAAETFPAQCRLLLRWLRARLQPLPQLSVVQRACLALQQEPSEATLDRIAGQLHLSHRHLRRLLHRHIGVGPGHYMRLSRFVRALYLMPSSLSLTEIAHEVHYFDQAHFVRDFKAIAGITPGDYRRRMGNVPGHLFDA